jgi:hypothetical protein
MNWSWSHGVRPADAPVLTTRWIPSLCHETERSSYLLETDWYDVAWTGRIITTLLPTHTHNWVHNAEVAGFLITSPVMSTSKVSIETRGLFVLMITYSCQVMAVTITVCWFKPTDTCSVLTSWQTDRQSGVKQRQKVLGVISGSHSDQYKDYRLPVWCAA